MKSVAHEREALRSARCLTLTRRRCMNGVGGHRVGPVPILIYCSHARQKRLPVTPKPGKFAAAVTGSPAERALRGGHFVLCSRINGNGCPQGARQAFKA